MSSLPKAKDLLCQCDQLFILKVFSISFLFGPYIYFREHVRAHAVTVVSDSLQPDGLQPAHPWNSPGKNHGFSR